MHEESNTDDDDDDGSSRTIKRRFFVGRKNAAAREARIVHIARRETRRNESRRGPLVETPLVESTMYLRGHYGPRTIELAGGKRKPHSEIAEKEREREGGGPEIGEYIRSF